MSLDKISDIPSTTKLSNPTCSQHVDTYYSIFLCTVVCCYFLLILMELNAYFKSSWTIIFLSINIHLFQTQNCIFICYMEYRQYFLFLGMSGETLALSRFSTEMRYIAYGITNKLIVFHRILLLTCVPYAHLRDRMCYL